jgi:Ca2+-transporting ATPase
MDWHAQTKEVIFKKLKTSEKGLTNAEAKIRLKKHGKNVLKKTKKLRLIKIILEQFKSFLIYALLIVAVFFFIIGHLIDAFVVLAIVLINAGIGFFQQYKAEKAILGLRKLLVPISKVIRDGKHIEVASTTLVPGDILVLEAGNKVNADARLLEADYLKSNEAVLTGESLPVLKESKKLSKSIILAERKNMLYSGTQVVKGSGVAVIVATGMESEFGKIALDLQEIADKKTPMQKRVDTFAKHLSLVTFALVIIIFILGLLRATDVLDTLMIAITLAVGAIPEGLPAVLAIAFAIASRVMSKKNVVIRKLPAVESLGSVTVICSDKTGTITEEQMHVQEIFVNDSLYTKKQKNLFLKNKEMNPKNQKEISKLIQTSLLCNNARYELIKGGYSFLGDPTEEALVRLGLDLGFDKKNLTEKEPKLKEFPFDSKRKMMSILRQGEKKIIYSKGAIGKILALSSSELIQGQVKPLSEKRKEQLRKKAEKMEEKAFRVLAFAYKEISSGKIQEKDLTFLGFTGMLDPPRKEIKKAIQECKDAGIKVKIITGDSLLTAKTVSAQVGIQGKAITGKELEKMDDASLSSEIDNIVVFARTTPHQKLRIAKILQQKGEVVAMTGDGINDVLALKSADIGIAMGQRGTDVARDVSDVVLVDDNFASIVEGVKQGRKTYDNIKKFTKYMLSVNFDTILLVVLVTALGYPLPILPLQILWKNIVTDSYPALSLVYEKGEQVMKSKPRKEKSILSGIWKFVIFGGILNFLACFSAYFIGISHGLDKFGLTTLVVTTGVIFELLFVYTCRSEKSLFKGGVFSNKKLNYAILIGIVLHLVLLYTALGSLFHVVPLPLKYWAYIIPLGFSGLIISEIVKLFRKAK